MASITRCGTCVPPGPSRKVAGWPLTVWASEGNWARTQVRSRAAGAVSVVGMVVYFYHDHQLKSDPGDRKGVWLRTAGGPSRQIPSASLRAGSSRRRSLSGVYWLRATICTLTGLRHYGTLTCGSSTRVHCCGSRTAEELGSAIPPRVSSASCCCEISLERN